MSMSFKCRLSAYEQIFATSTFIENSIQKICIVLKMIGKDFKSKYLKFFGILSALERWIHKIGRILKFCQLEGIHHIVDERKHLLER